MVEVVKRCQLAEDEIQSHDAMDKQSEDADVTLESCYIILCHVMDSDFV